MRIDGITDLRRILKVFKEHPADVTIDISWMSYTNKIIMVVVMTTIIIIFV